MRRSAMDADDPRRWLDFAESDLRLAGKGKMPGVRLEGLCYLAQQAAEKALKAVLMSRKVHFPKTHQIQALLELLPEEMPLSPSLRGAAGLSDYAVEGRYPQNFEDVTEKEYRSALASAASVVDWAKKQLKTSEGLGPVTLQEPPVIYRTGKTKLKARKKAKR